MIIPYGHERPISRVPYLTFTIIGICTLVQIYATWFAPDVEVIRAALKNARSAEDVLSIAQAYKGELEKIPMLRLGYATGSGWNHHLVTSAFVHGGWFHLIGNMLFLWLAGSALEDRLGRIRFAGLYLAGAAAATLAFDAFHTGSPTLLVGASGAVSALMGAFLVYFAGTRILLWYFLAMRSGTWRVAAYVVLPLWLAEQLFYAYYQSSAGLSQVAYTAHIGGFAFGLAIAYVTRMVFGVAADEEGSAAAAPAVEAPTGSKLDQQYQRSLDAANAKDAGQLRPLASRVILDLARIGDHERIVELYQTISRKLVSVPLTDGAFAAAAASAQQLNYQRTYTEILETALREHPGSRLAPQFQQQLAAVSRR